MIDVRTLQDDYEAICWCVLQQGEVVSPRGMKTRELLGETIRIDDVSRSLPLYIGRGCNPSIGAIEAVQLVGGFSDPELVCRIAPNMKQFREEDGSFHGAYGPRVQPQIEHVLRRLRGDRDTRQAVLHIWDWRWDMTQDKKDLPCTVSLHFLIRADKLVLHTHMRSNDVWWGLAYDAFQFTQLQLTVAAQLSLEVGPYFHHTTSLHIYERDWDKVEELHPPTQLMPELWGFANADRAWKIGHGLIGESDADTDTERWYAGQLAPHLG